MLKAQRRRLYKLTYESKALLPSEADVRVVALQDILCSARIRNIRSGVSGILVYNQKEFYQVLEGNTDEVEEIFGSIIRDRRHTAVNVLERTFVRSRIFHSWSMGYVEFPAAFKWSERDVQDFPAMLRSEWKGESLGRYIAN